MSETHAAWQKFLPESENEKKSCKETCLRVENEK
jgi:hypothetical protein